METKAANGEEKTRVLIVDDDQSLRRLVREFLETHGFDVMEADSGAAMRALMETNPVDLVVLDVMMPGEDGLSIARTLSAQNDVAIIMISALGSETDRIIGLEVGADDYLPKPVSPRELLARIRAVLRRQQGADKEQSSGGVYTFEGWELDIVRRILRDPSNILISLSEGEFSLLRAFAERPQRVLTRDQLLEYARGPDSDSFDRAIDTQISRLRRKLSSRGGSELIRTIRSEGYMFLPRVTRK
jgi:two-component system OmpR family response regulator